MYCLLSNRTMDKAKDIAGIYCLLSNRTIAKAARLWIIKNPR